MVVVEVHLSVPKWGVLGIMGQESVLLEYGRRMGHIILLVTRPGS